MDINNYSASACNFIKKETLAQVFSCDFCEISTSTFFTEHLWKTASAVAKKAQEILVSLKQKKRKKNNQIIQTTKIFT